MPYNPFDIVIGDPLKPSDLQKLIDRSVAEGYFIEYKSIPPANEKMGKSIASFANTYGGWYIVGVTTDAHNVANAISGFDPALCPDPIARIREVIKSHISPSPMFFAQVVTLANNNLVLVVYVPDGQDSPFISRDGRIYRRRHDSSDPIPETDRYAIDRLVEQGRRSQKEFARFCRDERVFSKDESKRMWVSIYIQPYPYGCVNRRDRIGAPSVLDEAISLSQRTRSIPVPRSATDTSQTEEDEINSDPFTGYIPFTSGLLTTHGIILRQVESARIGINANISAELFFDGSVKFHFELPIIHGLETPSALHRDWNSSVKRESVRETLLALEQDDASGSGITRVHFVDIANLWATVALLVTYYQAWLGDEPALNDVKMAISLSGIWRTSPFLDADEWAEFVKKYGLPVIQQDEIWVPSDVSNTDSWPYSDTLWISICGLIQLALGLPLELLGAAMNLVSERQQGN